MTAAALAAVVLALVGCRSQPRPPPPPDCCCVYAAAPDEGQLSLMTAEQCSNIEGGSCAEPSACELGDTSSAP